MTHATDHLEHPPICLQPIRIAEGEQEPETCAPEQAEAWRVFVYPNGRPHYYTTLSMALLAVERLSLRKEPPRYGIFTWPSATRFIA